MAITYGIFFNEAKLSIVGPKLPQREGLQDRGIRELLERELRELGFSGYQLKNSREMFEGSTGILVQWREFDKPDALTGIELTQKMERLLSPQGHSAILLGYLSARKKPFHRYARATGMKTKSSNMQLKLL